MTTQEKIVSLLQGDIKDEFEVADIINVLASSPDDRLLLLEYIRLGRRIDDLVLSVTPSAKIKMKLWNQIEYFEHGFSNSSRYSKVIQGIKFNLLTWIAIATCLFLGFSLGVSYKNVKEKGEKWPTRKANNYSESNVLPLKPDSKIPAQIPNDKEIFVSEIKQVNMPLSPASLNSPKSEVEIIGTNALKIVSPNGGESFKAGSLIPIIWSDDTSSNSSKVLELSLDGGTSWGRISLVRKGRKILWKIPNSIDSSVQCVVRVGVADSNSLSPHLMRTFIGHDSAVSVAEISPDGQWLATVSSDAKIRLWNLQTGQLENSMIGHKSAVTFAKFNKNSTKLVSCSQDGSARIWDLRTGKQEQVFEGQGQEKKIVWAAAFNPDGSVLAVANDDGSITLWDTKSANEIKLPDINGQFKPHLESVRYIEYTLDGNYIITSSVDKTASIIEAKTGKVVQVFVHHVDDSLDSRATREELREALRRRTVNGVQITPDGTTLITAGYNGIVKFWDIKTGNLIRAEEYHSGKRVSSIALSRDGKWLVSVGYDGTAKIIEVFTGDVLATIIAPKDGVFAPMIRASFSPDRQSLAIAHLDGRATVWRLNPLLSSDISDSFWSIEPCGTPEPEIE